MSDNPKFQLQDEQYQFPYHYIPSFDENQIGKKYRYSHKGYEYLCYVKHVLELIRRKKPESLLEVGCGDGRVIGLVQDVKHKIGVDLSEKAIAFAKAFNPDIDLFVKDASELEEKFDIVAAVEVLEHIPDKKIPFFFNTLEDRTKDGGHVIITVPTKNKAFVKKHYRHYDIETFKRQLMGSNVNLKIENVEYIFKDSKLIRLYRRVTRNKYWFIQIPFFEKIVWNYVWNRLRYAKEFNGLHLVVTLRKG
jgi:cyclopropane fatty-acyl-phospholipid synthase-like methyltransferase